MQTAMNPMVDMYQTQLEASRRLADVVFAGTERIDRVMIEATHRAVTDQLNFAQAVASTRDPNGVANLQATYLSRRPDNAVNYQREIVRIFAEVQSEIGKSMQYYMEQFGSTMANSASAVSSRIGQDKRDNTSFNPVTGMFSVWETAFREIASMTNRNLAAARSSFENVTSATANAAQRAAAATADATQTATSAAADAADTAAAGAFSAANTAASTMGEAADAADDRSKSQPGGKRR